MSLGRAAVAKSASAMPASRGPVPTTIFVPRRSTMRALIGATTSMVSGQRQQAHAGLERREAQHELEVLREQEDRAEHREEDQHDARRSRR